MAQVTCKFYGAFNNITRIPGSKSNYMVVVNLSKSYYMPSLFYNVMRLGVYV